MNRNLSKIQFPTPGAWGRAHESHVGSLREEALTDLYHAHRYSSEPGLKHNKELSRIYQESHDSLMAQAASHDAKTCEDCKEYVAEEIQFGPDL